MDAIEPVYPETFLIPVSKTKSTLNLLKDLVPLIKRPPSLKINMNDTSTWPSPPTSGKMKEGLPSRQKPALLGEKSLYDEKGGEWRYAREDKYHYPHWDYKESPTSAWKNISINGNPIIK